MCCFRPEDASGSAGGSAATGEMAAVVESDKTGALQQNNEPSQQMSALVLDTDLPDAPPTQTSPKNIVSTPIRGTQTAASGGGGGECTEPPGISEQVAHVVANDDVREHSTEAAMVSARAPFTGAPTGGSCGDATRATTPTSVARAPPEALEHIPHIVVAAEVLHPTAHAAAPQVGADACRADAVGGGGGEIEKLPAWAAAEIMAAAQVMLITMLLSPSVCACVSVSV
jgi:hypothetical protein